jgi:hypothetical protein
MFREHRHTCTNEADDDSGAIILKRKNLNVAMFCIYKEKKRRRTRIDRSELPDIEL